MSKRSDLQPEGFSVSYADGRTINGLTFDESYSLFLACEAKNGCSCSVTPPQHPYKAP